MQVPLLDLVAQYAGIKDEILAQINEVLDSQRCIGGPKVEELEKAIAKAGIALARAESGSKAAAQEATDKADALAKRIEAGREKLAAVDTYLGAMAEYRKTATAREEAQREHADLDRLCELLGPDGIRKDLAAGGGVADFQAQLNGHLQPMGFEVDLGPLLTNDGEATVNGLPARLLSSSEQIRFGLAFQIAVASASGLGLVVVGDFDRLDYRARPDAMNLLSKCGHQVLVLMTIKGALEGYRESAGLNNATGRGARYLLVELGENGSRIEMPTAESVRKAG